MSWIFWVIVGCGALVLVIMLINLIRLGWGMIFQGDTTTNWFGVIGTIVSQVAALPLALVQDVKTVVIVAFLFLVLAQNAGGDFVNYAMYAAIYAFVYTTLISLTFLALSRRLGDPDNTAKIPPAFKQLMTAQGLWGAVGLILSAPLLLSAASMYYKTSAVAQQIYNAFSVTRPLSYKESWVFIVESMGRKVDDLLPGAGQVFNRGESTLVIPPSDWVTNGFIWLFPAFFFVLLISVLKFALASNTTKKPEPAKA